MPIYQLLDRLFYQGRGGMELLDENNDNQLTCIEFERIKGGKPFNPQVEWFQSMINEIGQK